MRREQGWLAGCCSFPAATPLHLSNSCHYRPLHCLSFPPSPDSSRRYRSPSRPILDPCFCQHYMRTRLKHCLLSLRATALSFLCWRRHRPYAPFCGPPKTTRAALFTPASAHIRPHLVVGLRRVIPAPPCIVVRHLNHTLSINAATALAGRLATQHRVPIANLLAVCRYCCCCRYVLLGGTAPKERAFGPCLAVGKHAQAIQDTRPAVQLTQQCRCHYSPQPGATGATTEWSVIARCSKDV